MFNHMLDVAFEIETVHENYEDIPAAEIIKALQKRVDRIRKRPGEIYEAIGLCDTFEYQPE